LERERKGTEKTAGKKKKPFFCTEKNSEKHKNWVKRGGPGKTVNWGGGGKNLTRRVRGWGCFGLFGGMDSNLPEMGFLPRT